MLPEGIDENLIQEFLTEANELIEHLDADLVSLESEPEPQDLLDGIFRALHTIKGAASFLSLPTVTEFAHAAEDALNKLRKGEVSVSSDVIDALLRSVDVLRGQMEELGAGDTPSAGPADLIKILEAISASSEAPDAKVGGGSTAPAADATAQDSPSDNVDGKAWHNGEAHTIELPSEKLDVLPFMASDLRDSSEQLEEAIDVCVLSEARKKGAVVLSDLADSMNATADFFDFEGLTRLVGLVDAASKSLPELDEALVAPILARLRGVRELALAFADGLDAETEFRWDTKTLEERTTSLLGGTPLGDDVSSDEPDDPRGILVIDDVMESIADPTADSDADGASATSDNATSPQDQGTPTASSPPASTQAAKSTPAKRAEKPAAVEQTIRVEVSRLESLLNLVGEMVLTKNQVLGFTRRLRDTELSQDMLETIGSVASDLDRLTSELQVGVMRTRMQPLSKLFGRYPRIIRDLAKKTEKEIDLVIEGGDTEVDKSVLEQLADPLVHILRNSADHGLEGPAERRDNGKPAGGTITLTAEHQGGHVRVAIKGQRAWDQP